MVAALNIFEFGLVAKKKLTNGEQYLFTKNTSCSDRHWSTRVLRDYIHAVKVNCILLSKGLCLNVYALGGIGLEIFYRNIPTVVWKD